MPKFAFWHTDTDAIMWSFDRAPDPGEEIVMGEKVYRVGQPLQQRRDPTTDAEFHCEVVRASAFEEQRDQLKRGVNVLPPAGAARLNRVSVALSRGEVELPWASRDLLLGEIKHLESARTTIDAFEAVGASRPVRLPLEGKGLLVEAINLWSQNVQVGGLPEGVWDLRCALIDDLHDTAGGP